MFQRRVTWLIWPLMGTALKPRMQRMRDRTNVESQVLTKTMAVLPDFLVKI